MMLPKGIVINTPSIYDEVAGYPTLPLDKVWKIWQVYTTTNKKLKDPTARRLENFWWHVLGSDRQHLSGKALAKLYEEISIGPTFAPLSGPSCQWKNRDDAASTAVDSLSLQMGDASSPLVASETDKPATSTATSSSLKVLSSSASKPPPPHPILKKTSGPSSSGPRPTARFATSHESAEEEDRESDVPSSGSTAVAGGDVRLVAAFPKKKSVKKFVASANSKSSKRRPVLQRRASSQSSTASDSAGPSAASRAAGMQRPVSPIPEKPSTSTTPQSHEDQSQVPLPGMSAKANGKRPMRRKETGVPKEDDPAIQRLVNEEPKKKAKGKDSAKKASPRLEQAPPRLKQKRPSKPEGDREPLLFENRDAGIKTEAAPTSSPSATLSQVQSMIDLTSHRRKSSQPPIIGTDATLSSSHSPSSFGASATFSATGMARSSSHTGYGGVASASMTSQSWSSRRPPTSGLFTRTTASTTNVAALGTIIDQSGVGSLPDSSVFDSHRREQYMLPSMQSSSSLLDARMMPTQPSTSTSVPLGRTKSQLTLLLERDQARSNSQSRSRS